MTPIIPAIILFAIGLIGLLAFIVIISRRPVTTDTGKGLMVLIDGEWHVCGCGVLVRNNLTDEHIRLTHRLEEADGIREYVEKLIANQKDPYRNWNDR